jgi:O-antigen/teichoic acid export membrane protein
MPDLRPFRLSRHRDPGSGRHPVAIAEHKSWLAQLSRPLSHASVRGSAWGLADQALTSATTFLTMVYLARGLGPSQFGVVSLAYLGLLLANSLQNALITQPHNILGSSLEGPAYRDFTTSLALAQLALAAAFAFAALAGAVGAAALGYSHQEVLVALAVAVPAWQLQEFARRVLYTKRHVRAVFWNDAISYGGQLALVIFLVARHWITAAVGLYAMAGTSVLAAVAGLWSIRTSLRGRLVPSTLRECWAMGKWFSASTLANWFASQMYPVLTAGVLGAYATGVFRALQNLIAPTQILANTFQMMATPHASREYSRGGVMAVTRFLGLSTPFLAIPLLLYYFLIGVFARPLITFFYSAAYTGAAGVIWPLGLAYLLSYTGRVLGIGLSASRDARPLLYAQLAAAGATFSVGVLLIRGYGLVGAALGAAISQSVQAATLAWYFHRRRALA